jgi:hypothetical protein
MVCSSFSGFSIPSSRLYNGVFVCASTGLSLELLQNNKITVLSGERTGAHVTDFLLLADLKSWIRLLLLRKSQKVKIIS